MSIGALCELARAAMQAVEDESRLARTPESAALLRATRIWTAKVTHYADQLRLAGAQIEILPPKRGES